MMGPRLRQGSCRLCLWESNSLWDIFGELAERRNFSRKIEACVNIIVSKDDGLSSLICPNCIYKIELFYDFQASCKRSDEIQKRYNGLQDAGRADITEDVRPSLNCPVSNMDALPPVETIDIKEEPIDNEEVVTTSAGDGQLKDADLEVQVGSLSDIEVVQNVLNGECAVAEQQQQQREEELEGRDGENGSCIQLTPPRSPSLESEATCSASETGSNQAMGFEVTPPEQEAAQAVANGPTTSTESAGRSCRHCGKWLQDPRSCWQHEWQCLHSTTSTPAPAPAPAPAPTPSPTHAHAPTDASQKSPSEALEPPQLPPRKYYNQCRFCLKWFQKTGMCRVHEIDCGPLHGYASPPLPQARGSETRCRFCCTYFRSKSGRVRHEKHCLHSLRKLNRTSMPADDGAMNAASSSKTQSDGAQQSPKAKKALPPPAKYNNQCRFCRKYYPKVHQRRVHEVECGPLLGYPAPPLPPVAAALPDNVCSTCGKVFKAKKGRLGHEYYCHSNSVRVNRVARLREFLKKRPNFLPGPTRHNLGAKQCRYCHGRFLSAAQRISHEYSCAKKSGWVSCSNLNQEVQVGGQDAAASIKCRYCGKGHLKWRSLLTHEYHCRRKGPHVASDVEAAGGGGNDECAGASVIGCSAPEEKNCQSPNCCSHCGKELKHQKACRVHEYYCSRVLRFAKSESYPYGCCYCSRGFLTRKACVLHEYHCLKAKLQSGETSATVKDVSGAEQQHLQQQISSTSVDTKPPDAQPDKQVAELPDTPASERKRKKMVIPLCEPVTLSTNDTEDFMCRYCDKRFKYRECLRTHEVKCSALAAYQYTTPHHRTPRFFTCPLCRKAFKFRRKLHNHWKVCRARTSVAAEAAGMNNAGRFVDGEPKVPEEIDGVPEDITYSPGEDREGWSQWHGWPSCHSAESLTDEDSSTVDSSGISCKLCHKDFCSRILLELHTLNECVYQRIRNDHPYAQCESPSVDESTLMRRARVELQRLLLCSCCGRIFEDKQALADHESAERHGSQAQMLWEVSMSSTSSKNEAQDLGPNSDTSKCEDSTAQQERMIKLEHAADECRQQESRKHQKFGSSAEELAEKDKPQCLVSSIRNEQLESTKGKYASRKSSILREFLQRSECSSLKGTAENQLEQLNSVDSEHKPDIQSRGTVLQQQERQSVDRRQQLQNWEGKQELNKNYQSQLEGAPDKQFYSTDRRSDEVNQMKASLLQQQEVLSNNNKQPLQNKLMNLNLHSQQKQLENPTQKQHDQKCGEEHHVKEVAQEKHCLKFTASHGIEDTKQCQVNKYRNLSNCFMSGVGNPSEFINNVPAVPCILP